MNRPRILDLFSGAGGVADGYRRAGLIPFGVDLAPMPRYPYQFKRADALDFLRRYGREFDVIHASPPCERYSLGTQRWAHKDTYPDLIDPVRELLEKIGRPYIIENVELAPLRNTMCLCGTMFPGLRVFRHRLFESNVRLVAPYPFCVHTGYVGFRDDDFVTVAGHGGQGTGRHAAWCDAMQINWMNHDELKQSIPPAYTHWIGAQLMQHLGLTPLSWPITRAVQERLFA